MTDAELIARLRDWMEHDEGKINDAREKAADRIEALLADLARSTRMIAKMVPLSADGNYVFWDGVGDIELDHNGELRNRIEALTEQLTAARQDAKEAEAYAEELERGQKTKALEQILDERGAVFDAMVDAAEDAAGKDVSFNVVVGRALRAALAEIKSSKAAPPYGLKGENHE